MRDPKEPKQEWTDDMTFMIILLVIVALILWKG